MGIDIAIIDSGVNPAHPHVNGVAGGVTFHLDRRGRPAARDGFEDRIGHGTAVAGIFRERLPDARLWAVKIFHEDLAAPSALLFAALDWAVAAEKKIIHLSLGTQREEDRAPLERLCRTARDKGLFLLAAARRHDDRVYPAVLPSVIGVYWNRSCGPGGMVHHPGHPVEFGAWGHPRPLPGLDPRRNFRGSSFAVAHVSARLARILSANGDADRDAVLRMLAREADVRPAGSDPTPR